jgi:5'-nucleotidase
MWSKKTMRILLTNDDGIFAPGLTAIYKELVKIGDVMVVAPADSRSGTSHSITFAEPLLCSQVDVNGIFKGFSVEGSPADCVKLAVMQLCEEPIDLIVAGINHGANIGINVYYSGTVAAAMEGVFLNIPSVAMSLAAERSMDFELAAEYCSQVLEKLLPVKTGHVLNINIPPLSMGQPKGVKVVPQSTQAMNEHYIAQENENGQTVFQLAGGLHKIEAKPADVAALIDGFITVTALAPDMTDHRINRKLRKIKW